MRLGFIIIASIAFPACKNDKSKPDVDITKPQQVIADSNSDGIMRVEVELKDETLKISIQDRPKDGQMTCELNGSILEKCEDGMEIAKPADGSYRLRVRVMDKDKLVSIGETRFQAGKVPDPSPEPVADSQDTDPLSMEITNPDFVNGNAIPMDKAFELSFRFKKEPKCKAVLRCIFDKTDAAFSPLCNQPLGHKFSADRIARGLQYLSIQASCDQSVGPTLVAYWYGVPADYQPLQVESTIVGVDNHIFRLVKSNDCPEDLLRYECSDTSSGAFASCKSSRRTPKAGFRIRALCNGQIGPTLAVRP